MPDREKYMVYLDPEIRELIPGFLENRDKDVTQLHEAITRDDFQKVVSIAHKMKGTGGSYGFAIISKYGLDLSVAAQNRDKGQLSELVNGLADYLTKVEIKYR